MMVLFMPQMLQWSLFSTVPCSHKTTSYLQEAGLTILVPLYTDVDASDADNAADNVDYADYALVLMKLLC